MNNIKVLACPNGLAFACDFNKFAACDKCSKRKECEEIKNRYNINDIHEPISFSKARDFIKDIWGKTWAYPIDVKRNAKKYGLVIEFKQETYSTWKITYSQIFDLMNIPLWKTLHHRGNS